MRGMKDKRERRVCQRCGWEWYRYRGSRSERCPVKECRAVQVVVRALKGASS